MKYAHFIGCGGAGCQPLAMIFHELGYTCSGSDLLSNAGTRKLAKAGIRVFQGHAAENLAPELTAENALVIYSSAAQPDNPEMAEARKRGIRLLRRGDALALAAEHFPVTIAVGGSHGKTTTSSVIVHILTELGMNPGYLIGGSICGNPVSGTAGAGKVLVSEVDESDSTIASFKATLGVVTNIEDDHCWSVGGVENLYKSFRTFAEKAEKLLYVSGKGTDSVLGGLSAKSRVLSTELPDLKYPPHWGGFQRADAATAIAAVKWLFPELDPAAVESAAMRFPGVERRMTLRIDNGSYKVIEDYAHHPTELAASLAAFRETNPGCRLVVIFQPHRFARLKRYMTDFVRVLSTADRVFVVPVFAAWTDKSDVNSHTLAEKIGAKATAPEGSWQEIGETVKRELKPGDVAAVIGAGDLPAIFEYL